MASTLDMSLDDIIKTNKAGRTRSSNNRGRASGPARSSGPTRNLRGSRDTKKPYQAGIQQFKSTPVAPLHTSVIRQSVPDGSKIQVSNLDHRVTAEDLKLVFSSRVGPLKKCTLMYDQNGKSNGTAVVHFNRVGDAALAQQKFNGVPLDGRAMKIELVVAPGAAQAVLPPAQTKPAGNQGQQRGQASSRGQAPSRGRRGGRGGARGRGEKRENKTTDQLDAEMNDYMQVDA
ncbi:hypothetical protein BGX34_004337 [Mortierella sp. NVP85]|nr:hypothetical protein BGX34_004337 [Mortierella sp. NVP85]